MFASSNTTFGDLPPSSSVHFLIVDDASCMIRRPTTVEPVNDTLSTSGCDASSSPTVAPPPAMMLTTPFGSSVSSSSSASRSAVSGVSEAGFSTHEFPIASAGASFHTAITSGKFHGMIPAQTPTGSRSTKLYECVGNSTGSSASCLGRSAARAKYSQWLMQ
jgi:hypothetical protein